MAIVACCCLGFVLFVAAIFIVLRFTELGREATDEIFSEITDEVPWLDTSTQSRPWNAEPFVTVIAFGVDADVEADPYYNFIACGTADGSVHIYDAADLSLVASFKDVAPYQHRLVELAIGSQWEYVESTDDFRYGGEYILWTTANEAGVLVWDPRNPPDDRILSNATVGDTWGCFFDPFYDSFMNHLWVFDTASQAAQCYDCATGELVNSEALPEDMPLVRRVLRSTNGRYSLIELESSELTVCDTWEATGGMVDFGLPVYDLPGNGFPGFGPFAISSTGYLAMAGEDDLSDVIVRDIVEDKVVWEFQTEYYYPSALAFSYHGDRLAIGGQSTVEFWDMYTGQLVDQLQLP